MMFNHFFFEALSSVISLSFLLPFIKTYAKGEDRNTEENVPANTPTNRAKMKPRMVSPPKMKMASNTTKVEPEVLNERVNVLFTALFMFTFHEDFGCNPTFSRIRSKITTVALME